MNAKDQIEALSKAVTSTDAGRRVGWARAYSAEATKDDLSRETNILRKERDLMRHALSFLYGFVQAYAPHEVHERLSRHFRDIGAILDSKVAEAGKDFGSTAVTPEVDAQRRATRAASDEAKKRQSRSSARLFRHAREQERRKIMERYGIPNEAALWNYLEQYDG